MVRGRTPAMRDAVELDFVERMAILGFCRGPDSS
jgi:hypothetical protein